MKRTPIQVKRSAAVLRTAAEARENPGALAKGGFKTTGISLPGDVLELLNDVAQRRKKTRGGRASVSAILLELVEQHRSELEAELR